MATVSTNTNLTSVSYSTGETITIDSGATLTIDSTPATRPGTILCITSGKLLISNTSTTTPIVVTLNSNTHDFRFEKNGIFEARGNMIELGTGNGSASQAFDLSSSPLDAIPYPSYVEVEDAVGTGVYTPWMVAGVAGFTINRSTSEFSSLDAGNVFFWNSSTRSLYVGDGTNGNVIPSGRKVRIPNIYLHSNANNATPSLRSQIDLNPSGTADLECVAMSNAIYWLNTTFTKVRCIRTGIVGDFRSQSANGTVELRGFSVCPDTEQDTVANQFVLFAIFGSVILDRITTLVAGLPTGGDKNRVQQVFALTSDDNVPRITNSSFARIDGRTSANDEAFNVQNLPSGTFIENVAWIGGRIETNNMVNATFIDCRHADSLSTTQSSSVPSNVIFTINSSSVKFINLGNAGVSACRGQIINADAQSTNVEMFNGTYDGGNNTGGIATGNGANLSIYNFTLTNMRSGGATWDSPSTYLASGGGVQNCRITTSGSAVSDGSAGAIFDLVPATLTSFNTVYSAATNYAFANVIDPGLTPTTGGVVIGPFGAYSGLTLTGNAQFDQNGGVEMPSNGDTLEVESNFTMHAITAFQNTNPRFTYTQSSSISSDTTTAPSSLTIEFRIKNPTGSYGSYAALTAANLATAISGLSGYNSDTGLVMQLRVTATSDDSSRIFNQAIVYTDVDNTYVAKDASITLLGPNPTDVTKMYLFSDDTELATFTGAGTHQFSAAANFLEEVYFIRRDSGGFEIMRTRSSPQALQLGSNGNLSLFAGEEVQLAQAPDVADIKAKVDLYLDAAISSRLAAGSYTAPDNAGITANGAAIAALNNITASDVWSNPTRTVTGGTIDTNLDMRGTDNALLAANYAAPNNAGISTVLSNQAVINQGVKKASLSIPHSDDVA